MRIVAFMAATSWSESTARVEKTLPSLRQVMVAYVKASLVPLCEIPMR